MNYKNNDLINDIKNNKGKLRRYFFKKILFCEDECWEFLYQKIFINNYEKNKTIKRIINNPFYAEKLLISNLLSEEQKKIAINTMLCNLDYLIRFLKLACKLNNISLWQKYRIKAIKDLSLFQEEFISTLKKNHNYYYSNTFIKYDQGEVDYIWILSKGSYYKETIASYIFENQSLSNQLRNELFNILINRFDRIQQMIEQKFQFNDFEKKLIYLNHSNKLIHRQTFKTTLLEVLISFERFTTEEDYRKIYEKYKNKHHVGFLKKIINFNLSKELREEIESFILMCKLSR